MNMNEWIASPEFLADWKDAFRDTKKTFAHLSGKVSASSRREKTGALWTLIQQPYPGIHLLAIELQPDITPLTIQLKVWVNQNSQHLYDMLRSANPPELLGQRTVLSVNQKPRPSWESDLRKHGISLIGLRYTLADLSFLSDATVAIAELRRMGDEFITWLIANLATNGSLVQVIQPTIPIDSEKQKGLANPEVTYPDELSEHGLYPEGAAKTVVVNAYERNVASRQKCIEFYGPRCVVCELDFEERYGDLGHGFIHVHHEVPLSLIKQTYFVDPIRDLKPVCPNCHAMLHRATPPLSIKELRACLK